MLFTRIVISDLVLYKLMAYDMVIKFFFSFLNIYVYCFLYVVFMLSSVSNEFVFSKVFKISRSSFCIGNHVVLSKTRKFLKGRVSREFFYLYSFILPGIFLNVNLDYFVNYISTHTMRNNHLMYFVNRGSNFLFFMNDVINRVLSLNIVSVRKDSVFFKLNVPKINYRFGLSFFYASKSLEVLSLYISILSYFGYKFYSSKTVLPRGFHFYTRIL
jgi:hypothetical protein